MREMINYMVEANLSLVLFLAIHFLLLRNETNFRLTRFFLLAGILISVTFPLVHLEDIGQVPMPTIGQVIPGNWLPEVVISTGSAAGDGAVTNLPVADYWNVAGWVYAAGVALFLTWLGVQVFKILSTARATTAYSLGNLKIFESQEDNATFSFFRLIYIGRAHDLTTSEKDQIIRHEAVHARQMHTIDLLLVTVVRIVFWFNPLLSYYKKIFIQIHEFEADARSVKDSDVNNYCSLLARVALQSAYFPIASHFNQSLTVKRIEMIRSIKRKIRPWKLGAIFAVIPMIFIAVACQDQLAEIADSTISQTGDYPPEVKAHMDAYVREHPDAKLTYMDGLAEDIDKLANSAEVKPRIVYNYTYRDGKKGVLLTDIVQHADLLQTDDRVFMVVEQQPEYTGGFDAFKEFLSNNIRYPKDAAEKGIKGTVYVSMVIGETGVVSDVNVLRGVSPSLDAEAMRVVRMLPTWIPGKQNGKAVKVRFTLPIRFDDAPALSGSSQLTPNTSIEQIQPANFKMKLQDVRKELSANGVTIRGRMVREDGTPLAGVTVLIAGTTTGTSTDTSGNFTLNVKSSHGKLVLSFIGFDTEVLVF